MHLQLNCIYARNWHIRHNLRLRITASVYLTHEYCPTTLWCVLYKYLKKARFQFKDIPRNLSSPLLHQTLRGPGAPGFFWKFITVKTLLKGFLLLHKNSFSVFLKDLRQSLKMFILFLLLMVLQANPFLFYVQNRRIW